MHCSAASSGKSSRSHSRTSAPHTPTSPSGRAQSEMDMDKESARSAARGMHTSQPVRLEVGVGARREGRGEGGREGEGG